jgi:hypothetical protein
MFQLLASAAFGLAAGLIGTGFQAHLQRKEKTEDRLERRREQKREKAELIFRELSDLVKNYRDHVVHAMQLLTQKDPPLAPQSPSNARVTALLLVYFPECAPILDKFDADMRKIVEEIGKEVREAAKAVEPDKIKGLHLILAQESANRANQFSEELRPALKAEIDKLWPTAK